MIQPYYERDGIVIYNADCRDVLPRLGHSADLLLTDPPYGIGRDGEHESTGSHGGRKAYDFLGWDNATPSSEIFKLMFAATKHQIIWGANYFTEHLPPSMGWLFWDKQQRICGSDGELAFTSWQKALRTIVLNRVEIARDGAVHPTQKPLRLMRWCIDHADQMAGQPVRTILDPFMGSGTTLRAAKDLGRRAIGIEISREYCDLAIERLRQGVLPLEVPG